MKTEIIEIIKRLNEGIQSSKDYNQPMDNACWAYEEGVIMTCNEPLRTFIKDGYLYVITPNFKVNPLSIRVNAKSNVNP